MSKWGRGEEIWGKRSREVGKGRKSLNFRRLSCSTYVSTWAGFIYILDSSNSSSFNFDLVKHLQLEQYLKSCIFLLSNKPLSKHFEMISSTLFQNNDSTKVSFFGQCTKMQLITLQNFDFQTCFSQFLWFFS